MSPYPHPTCSDCGVVLAPWQRRGHVCHRFQGVAEEVRDLEAELAQYLATARGQFDVWYAERTRSR